MSCACVYVCMCVYVCDKLFLLVVSARVYACLCVCMCVLCMCMHVCVCVCVCVYVHACLAAHSSTATWFYPLLPTCPTHVLYPRALPTCPTHVPYPRALPTCPTHGPYPRALPPYGGSRSRWRILRIQVTRQRSGVGVPLQTFVVRRC
jgi:hypothetical protein